MAEQAQVRVKHNERYNGMGNDEYTGAFYYAENIDIRSNTRSFRLTTGLFSNDVQYYGGSTKLSNRVTAGGSNGSTFYMSEQGKLATPQWGQTNNSFDKYIGGWITDLPGYFLQQIIAIGNKLIVFGGHAGVGGGTKQDINIINITTDTSNDIDTGYGLLQVERLTTPDLTSATGWTVGAGWTLGATGAVHTSGVATLKQSIDLGGTDDFRVNAKIKDWTTGTVQLKYNGSNKKTCTFIHTNAVNYTAQFKGTNGAKDFEIVPSTDFNGRIEYISLRKVDTTKIVSKTFTNEKEISYIGTFSGDVYVYQDNTIKTMDTTSGVLTNAIIMPLGTTIVGMTEIGDNINIYTNNNGVGTKYIWDGVSSFPSVKIKYNGSIGSVVNNINQDYVTIAGDLHISEGYQAVKVWDSRISQYNSYEKAGLNTHRTYISSLGGMYKDLLLLNTSRGKATYGAETPGLPKAMVMNYKPSLDGYDNGEWIGTPTMTPGVTSPREYGHLRLTENRFAKSGYLITRPEVFTGLDDEKILDKIRIGYMLPHPECKINVSLCVNDDYYYTFYHGTLTTAPSIGDVYTINNNTFRVIQINNGSFTTVSTIVDKLYNDFAIQPYGSTILTKVSGDGQTSITYTDYDNFCYVKTFQETTKKYNKGYIYMNGLTGIDLPFVYKLSMKIELIANTTTSDRVASPEVNDITFICTPDQDEF